MAGVRISNMLVEQQPDSTMQLLIMSVESMPWKDVYAEWCAAGYNKVLVPDPPPRRSMSVISLDVAPGQRFHPQLENIVRAQLIQHGFALTTTRNWGSKTDTRLGLRVVDEQGGRPLYGTINFRVLGNTWVETYVRAQYLLHLLGVDTHYYKQPSA